MSPDMAALDLSKLLAFRNPIKAPALEQQLQAAAPAKSRRSEARIAAEKAAIEAAKAELARSGIEEELLEVEIKSAEDNGGQIPHAAPRGAQERRIQGLTHEIETTEAAIAGFEEEELKVSVYDRRGRRSASPRPSRVEAE